MRTFLIALFFSTSTFAADDLAAKLKGIADKPLLPKEFDAPGMLSRDVRARIRDANIRDYEEWNKITTKAEWEKFRDQRIAAMKKSLGKFPEPPKNMRIIVTKTIEGDGYQIENTLFESRDNFWVTANVYQPAKPGKNMPGILIVHSHHNPKTEGELQDMGVTWAKAGCYVLVMDQLGHGERRQHPFSTAESYPEPFRVGRQDYYFRYNLGLQLAAVGESLTGWMAWDLMRGVDLLLKKPGIDSEKICLLGSVAGGGDPAAVTAALDPRIKCLVPFNFGGPQPETRKLGDDAATAFNYAGGGSWESTRNLRDSARDGFLPWVIVASIAPRALIHAHEFAWDREHDPVWKRYEKIWGIYDAKDKLAFTHGQGTLTSKDPVGSHCNNIGLVHRKDIHVAFEKWFGIKVVETKDRHTSDELKCWTEEARKKLQPQPRTVYEAMANISHLVEKGLEWETFLERERSNWRAILGVDPVTKSLKVDEVGTEKVGKIQVVSLVLNRERAIKVPALLLLPKRASDATYPVVVAFAQEGKERFLRERADALSGLFDQGIAVCLPDLRGMGETRPGSGRNKSSSSTSISSSEEMLGTTVLGWQLQDLTAVLDYLEKRPDIDGQRIALWGESFAPANGVKQYLDSPHETEKYPQIGEPGATTLAIFGKLYHPSVKAILGRGGLVLNSLTTRDAFLYVPHDSLPPRFLEMQGPVARYATSYACPAHFEGVIDLQNRSCEERTEGLQFSINSSRPKGTPIGKVTITGERSDAAGVVAWFVKNLAK